MLSMAMMLFGLVGLLGVHPRKWLHDRWWLLAVGWVGMYLVSGLWSSNMEYWATRSEVKLPFLLLPLAFGFIPAFSYQHRKIFSLALNLVLLWGVVYSLSFLVTEPEFYIEKYRISNVLPTLPKGSHIVFSLSLTAAVIWNIYFHPFIRERALRLLNLLLIGVFVAMLHVLAVRTGLATFYVFVIGWCFYLSLRRKTRFIGLSVLVLLVAMAVLAASYLPTLKHKIGHMKYTLLMYEQGNMSGDYSDIGRYMSYDIAVQLIARHPLGGVGAGEMLDSMKSGYDQWYPHVPDEQRLVPHNQFLCVALGCGIPTLLLFIMWLLYPLGQIKRNRDGFFFLITWCVMLVPLMVEPFFEIQFGVFVYLIFLLWQRHAMTHGEASIEK